MWLPTENFESYRRTSDDENPTSSPKAKSPSKNRNRENKARSAAAISWSGLLCGLCAQKTPSTRHFRLARCKFLCIEDSAAERSDFELSGDFRARSSVA